MPQSLSSVYVHLVFSTKDRQSFLSDSATRGVVHKYIGGISKGLGCQPLVVGGVADHIHLLGALSRTMTIAEWVKELKRLSNPWISDRTDPRFAWQSGYGAFSVGPEDLSVVRRYIETQDEHHRTVGFQDEFRRFLVEHGIEFDERYVWD